MFKKFIWDFKRGDEFYQIPKNIKSEELGYYYFKFKEAEVKAGKNQALIAHTDENGIPMNRTYIDVKDQEYVYFPISIGQMGLAVFHTYLKTKSSEDKQRFLKFANWFVNKAAVDDECGVRWLTEVPLPQYKNEGPWQSAFSQSRGISILLRAHQITGDKKYFDLAQKALKPFTKSVAEGGVTSHTEWGPFYEEYPADEPVLVLNGHIFSLFGLFDFHRFFPENTLAEELFFAGYNTLINTLPEFDLGYWSRYNYCKADFYPEIDPATIYYQRLHILQLKVLNKIRYSDSLVYYIKRWQEQINLLNFIRAYWKKYKALKYLNKI